MYCLAIPTCCIEVTRFIREQKWINDLKGKIIIITTTAIIITNAHAYSPHLVLCHTPHLCSIYPSPVLAEHQPARCFPLQCFSLIPTGSLALPSVPLPSTGEWPLITVHGFYDEMPLAHLASSCQLPLTSHCLCATQTRAGFNAPDIMWSRLRTCALNPHECDVSRQPSTFLLTLL